MGVRFLGQKVNDARTISYILSYFSLNVLCKVSFKTLFMFLCYWWNWVPSKFILLKPYTSVFQNMTIFGDGGLKRWRNWSWTSRLQNLENMYLLFELLNLWCFISPCKLIQPSFPNHINSVYYRTCEFFPIWPMIKV